MFLLTAIAPAALRRLRHHELRLDRMMVQILDSQARRLAGPHASYSQDVDKQTQLVVVLVRCDNEFADLAVGQDHVAGLLSIRQAGQSDLPSLAVLNPLVVLAR